MSEIKVDTLTGKTTANDITVTVGATATMSLETGLVKAWINFDGTGTAAARDSFGLSSLTDLQTGEYRHTFTSSFTNNDYASSGTSRRPGTSSGGPPQIPSDSDADMTTSYADGYTARISDGVNIDQEYNTVVFHGDFA